MNRYDFIKKIKVHRASIDEKVINSAIDVAIRCHSLQKRESGEPYYYHPLEVAYILAKMNLDTSSLVAAILHDTVEDTDLSLEEIEEEFGSDVAKMVDGLTKLSKIHFEARDIRQAENFRKLLLAMSNDARVLLIKLADRLHNMRTIHHVQSIEKQKRIALETLQIYAPLSERIGIQKIKIELQDLSFGVLYPDVKNTLVQKFDSILKNAEFVISSIVNELKEVIRSKSQIKAKIYGRKKTLYSAWMKMQQKNVSINQLVDIIAFRIIVNKKIECYNVLGLVHEKYKMVPGSFQDFISTPKNNGYQSLHTVVFGPFSHHIEIQIRTEQMHRVAEFGIAAHWKYKQNHFNIDDLKRYNWIRSLLKILEQNKDPVDFLKHSKMAMYYDQVFCFSKDGEIIALPKNATVIDFAYSVLSELASKCKKAMVNNIEVPLNTVLVNGNIVEIIIGDVDTVVPEWKKFAATGQAKSMINDAIMNRNKSQIIEVGKSLIKDMFSYIGTEQDERILKKICAIFSTDMENLCYEIGRGGINYDDLFRIALINNDGIHGSELDTSMYKGISNSQKSIIMPLNMSVNDVEIRYAKCCNPIFGERIVGVQAMHIIEVHVADCGVLAHTNMNEDVIIDLKWDFDCKSIPNIKKIRVFLLNTRFAMSNLTKCIAEQKCILLNIRIVTRSRVFFEVILDIELEQGVEINHIIKKIKEQNDIQLAYEYS